MSNDLRVQFEDLIGELFAQDDAILKQVHIEAEKANMPAISINPQDGALLQFLLRSINAKTIVEIGTLAGYSGIWMARALPEDGILYTIDSSTKHITVAQANFERAKLGDKIHIVQGNALEVFHKIEPKGAFDFVFIDADKPNYVNYLNWAIDNLRSGGIIAAHNAYRGGRVLTPESDDDKAMRHFLDELANNDRLQSMIIPLGDGMAVGLKK